MHGLLLGMDGCGKTLLLRHLRLYCEYEAKRKKEQKQSRSIFPTPGTTPRKNKNETPKMPSLFSTDLDTVTSPTTGVEIEELVFPTNSKEMFQVREVGGPMLTMWACYLKSCKYLMYMFDISNACQMVASITEFYHILASPDIQNKPILILINKSDLPCGIPFPTWKSFLCYERIQETVPQLEMLHISSTTGENLPSIVQWIQAVSSTREK